MLRQSLARSAWRTGRRAANASRAFATTPQRQAEVELTVGERPRIRVCRGVWEALANVVVDTEAAGSALIQACEKAGVTIPRYVNSPRRRLEAQVQVGSAD
ncbi:NADH-ubiquinone oxidoreductase 78 kDa subunit, mitochondrial [Tolypocladium capitatum]|uniref:NADH-ubiquinone oxidoreductase 78 kDa subunit, mitochondrial n=1 Tax=Tolypocladium capitatum TaxID=45235 RepID=A0A2K3QGL3_9HYPO|nr:NADH-ubiquinone oxidoreductase 78 kDa subunit, mitochondrial [Tolypocladium capitatum]